MKKSKEHRSKDAYGLSKMIKGIEVCLVPMQAASFHLYF
jgi:hypothetical protein